MPFASPNHTFDSELFLTSVVGSGMAQQKELLNDRDKDQCGLFSGIGHRPAKEFLVLWVLELNFEAFKCEIPV
jgi:hypothetical protein